MDPRAYTREAKLKDGSAVRIRAIRPDDRDALAAGFARLSGKSVYHRFFAAKKRLSSSELAYLTELDFSHHVGIGAEMQKGDLTIPMGVARYVIQKEDSRSAEMAIAVEDAYQGIGVGTVLLQSLVDIAREQGVQRLEAIVLTDNSRMIGLLEKINLETRFRKRDGVTSVVIIL